MEPPFRTRERSADHLPTPVLPSIKDKCATCVCAGTNTNVAVVVQATLCQNAQTPHPPPPPPPVPGFRTSPLGVVQKKAPGEYRVIHHLSYPQGNSVNDCIPQQFSSVHYATVHDAIAFIKRSPATIFLGKVDIESAFRIIPVSPLDRPLLGFQWRGLFYMDAVLPMGCSSSC